MSPPARRAVETSAFLALSSFFGRLGFSLELSTSGSHYVARLHRAPPVTIDPVANIVFSLCATLGALAISIPSAVKGRWAVAVVFALLALGFLMRARAGYRRGEWR